MLLSGLRSAEVLSLRVVDVDIARRWVRVFGKGGKERSVSIDTDVAGAIETYLLAERPETDADALFVVAKGAHRGRPLTPAGLRTVFRYHRERSGVAAAVNLPSCAWRRARRYDFCDGAISCHGYRSRSG